MAVLKGKPRPAEEQVKVDPDGPQITVDAPHIDAGPMGSPLEIRVRWQARAGASIDMASLKVIYVRDNVLLDRTDRVRKCGTTMARLAGINCRLDAEGLFVEKAAFDKGRYTVVVQLADTERRTTRREFVVEIA